MLPWRPVGQGFQQRLGVLLLRGNLEAHLGQGRQCFPSLQQHRQLRWVLVDQGLQERRACQPHLRNDITFLQPIPTGYNRFDTKVHISALYLLLERSFVA